MDGDLRRSWRVIPTADTELLPARTHQRSIVRRSNRSDDHQREQHSMNTPGTNARTTIHTRTPTHAIHIRLAKKKRIHTRDTHTQTYPQSDTSAYARVASSHRYAETRSEKRVIVRRKRPKHEIRKKRKPNIQVSPNSHQIEAVAPKSDCHRCCG